MEGGEPSLSRLMEVTVVADGVFRVGLFRGGRPADRGGPARADHRGAGEPAELAAFADLVEVESACIADGPRLVTRRRPGERFFACGERTSGLEKTGTRQVFWNVDPPAGHTASFNNLYTSIPFTLALHEGRATGFFLDNPGLVEFALGKSDPSRLTATAPGSLVFYLFSGPTPRDVVEQF